MRFSEFIKKYTPFPNFTAFFVTGFCFGWICVIAGIWLNQFGRTPVLEKVINSTYSLVYKTYNDYVKPNKYASKNFYWLPERYTKKGVVIHQSESFADDFTLIISSHHQGADLIDKQGKVVHHWSFPYQSLLENKSIDPVYLYWWQAKIFPNGDILALVTHDNRTPAGLALIKLDKNSQLIWQYSANVHHDFDIDAQGNIYLLEQSIQENAPKELYFLIEPYIDAWLTIIDAQGQFIKKINIYSALQASPYRRTLRRISKSITGDYVHANSVKVVTEQQAQTTTYLSTDSVLISLRELDAIISIDLNSETVNWMQQGPWFYQHDPDILENGNLLIFDNLSLDKRSRVIEFDPRQQKVVWEYKGSEELPLYSAIRGGQQKLSNGNVLICESNGSRIVEVNMQGELVWEYYSIHRAQDPGSDVRYVPVLMSAHRYKQSDLSFLNEVK